MGWCGVLNTNLLRPAGRVGLRGHKAVQRRQESREARGDVAAARGCPLMGGHDVLQELREHRYGSIITCRLESAEHDAGLRVCQGEAKIDRDVHCAALATGGEGLVVGATQPGQYLPRASASPRSAPGCEPYAAKPGQYLPRAVRDLLPLNQGATHWRLVKCRP